MGKKAGKWGSGEGMEEVAPPEAPKDMSPITLTSEDEVSVELHKIAQTLQTITVKDNPWKERVEALERIERQLNGGSHKVPTYMEEACKLVRDVFVLQLSDLRSQVVKSACKTLQVMAMECKDAALPFIAPMLDPLLNASFVTIRVMSMSADACVKVIFAHLDPLPLLPTVLNGVHDPHKQKRQRVAEYTTIVLMRAPERQLALHSEAVERVLTKCCNDEASEVRTAAKPLFQAYKTHWPERAERVMSGLPPAIQKVIGAERTRASSAPVGRKSRRAESASSGLRAVMAARRRAASGAKKKKGKKKAAKEMYSVVLHLSPEEYEEVQRRRAASASQ